MYKMKISFLLHTRMGLYLDAYTIILLSDEGWVGFGGELLFIIIVIRLNFVLLFWNTEDRCDIWLVV